MAYFFGYGGYVLMTKKQRITKFRKFTGLLFSLYAAFHIFRSLIIVTDTEFFTANDSLLNSVMYIFGNLILIVASFGIILILKKMQDIYEIIAQNLKNFYGKI
jgi:hypothetical protein